MHVKSETKFQFIFQKIANLIVKLNILFQIKNSMQSHKCTIVRLRILETHKFTKESSFFFAYNPKKFAY